MARAFHDAGLPRGVLNLVFGVPAEISSYLISRPEIRLVAFTGSTAVGKQLTGLAARHMKPVLMELGGHAPVIVCADADPVKVGTVSAARKARNCGQVCTSPTRFYVHEDAYTAFTEAFVQRAQSITIGNGLDAGTEMGPLANHRRIEAMERLVADARGKGGRVLAGGERLGRPGYFFPVTVLTDVYPHRLWLGGRPDYLCVPTDYSRQVLERRRSDLKGRVSTVTILGKLIMVDRRHLLRRPEGRSARV